MRVRAARFPFFARMRLRWRLRRRSTSRLISVAIAAGVAMTTVLFIGSKPAVGPEKSAVAPAKNDHHGSRATSGTAPEKIASVMGKRFVDAAPRNPMSGPYALAVAGKITPPGAIRNYRPDQFRKDGPDNLHTFDSARPISADGLIQADLVPLRLYGIILPGRDRVCHTPDGGTWACGLRAYVTLYNLVTKGRIACEFRGTAVPAMAVCSIDGADIAEQLLKQGWAELAKGVTVKAYLQAVLSAKARKVGMWADETAFAARASLP
jgi:endonuclease YncB( thermonuclease family)